MDETRNVRKKRNAKQVFHRELRNRVVLKKSIRSSTRIRDRPERASSQSSRCIIRPRSASHLALLRELGPSDETGTEEEDAVTEDDDRIFPSVTRRTKSSVNICSNVTFENRHGSNMTNGHTSSVLDDTHESEGIRRSQRKRKLVYDNFNQSWILGSQNLRGYHSKEEHTEEEEAEEDADDSGDEEADQDKDEKRDEEEDSDAEAEENSTNDTKENKSAEQNEDTEKASGKENFEDMYSRVKRTRRKRIMISEDRPRRSSRTRSRKVIDSSEDERSSEDESQTTQSPRRHSKYHLRQRKPKVQHFQIEEVRTQPLRRAALSLLRSPMRHKRSRRARFSPSDSSSSSSDDDFERKKGRNRNMCLPVNVSTSGKPGGSTQNLGGQLASGSNLADTDPMTLDPNVRFSDVGGLPDHIRCLKEMVVFPMLYPEVFDKFKVQPPKGVLFHGPPGTGKTLLARALANECSQGTRRVSFFMRKGADCLSKWVGESERQLRLLFEQAYQMKPSIIFFDELDGLAPVRSCKQDQIHASIVSTLLALMDGLKNRGEVILIGATNRIDAIDPALRRPGRFDRELFFPLPAAKERLEILNIHMSAWKQAPPPELVAHLAETASGYCGSDLKALCTEAVIQCLRRRYPQIYESSAKLLLNPEQVEIKKCDFQLAQLSIVPAAHRVASAPARRLAPLVAPLLKQSYLNAVDKLAKIFPHCNIKSLQECKLQPSLVPHPKLILTGQGDQGQVEHVGPALLHHMEHVSVHSLELGLLFGSSGATPEEICLQTFREALRQLPSVLYIPNLENWWKLVPQTTQALLVTRLSGLEPFTPLLLLATTNCPFKSLPDEARCLFSKYREEVVKMVSPNVSERDSFFRPLMITKVLEPPRKPPHETATVREELPLAPPPEPPKLTEEQQVEVYKKEEMTLRELRIFLREICAKLARNKQFYMFVQPVNTEDAPDYLDIIKEPMDLEAIMSKIDRHQYECAADFLADIDLICRNALEYNPDRNNEGKMIRHRACYLHDTAHALIKAEMDSDFEDQCKNISKNRKKRAFEANKLAPEFLYTAPIVNDKQNEKETGCQKSEVNKSTETLNGDDEGSFHNKSLLTTPSTSSESKPKKRKSPWARGLLPSKKRRRPVEEKDRASPGTDTGGRNTPTEGQQDDNISEESLHGQKPDTHVTNKSPSPTNLADDSMEEVKQEDSAQRAASEDMTDSTTKTVQVDRAGLENLLSLVLDITLNLPLPPLLDLHGQLSRIVHAYDFLSDRTAILQEMKKEINKFEKFVRCQYK